MTDWRKVKDTLPHEKDKEILVWDGVDVFVYKVVCPGMVSYELNDLGAVYWAPFHYSLPPCEPMIRLGEPEPVHKAFGLTYAAYFVVPRCVLQSMPYYWQVHFVNLMAILHETIDYEYENLVYYVQLRDKRGRFIKDEFADYRRGRRYIPHRHQCKTCYGNGKLMKLTYDDPGRVCPDCKGTGKRQPEGESNADQHVRSADNQA